MKRANLLIPFLFSSNAVLLPYAMCYGQLLPEELIGPLAAATLITFVMLFLTRWWFRDDAKAIVVISLCILAVFSYASLDNLVGRITGMDRWAGGSGYFFVAWFLLCTLGITCILRRKTLPLALVSATRIIGLGIIVLPFFVLAQRIATTPSFRSWTPGGVPTQPIRGTSPDVYFIILDAYAGDGTLRGIHGYDNKGFLDGLERRGFRIAADSRSNYAQTHLSIASSLNMQYLNDLTEQLGTTANTRVPLLRMIQNNNAAAAFRARGYQYVTLSTGYLDNALGHSDLYVSGPAPISSFWDVLIEVTPISAFPRLRSDMYRGRVRYVFDELSQLPRNGKPRFVFAYISVPHHPFVFSENGDPVSSGRPFTFAEDRLYYAKNAETRAEYWALYLKQLRFVNERVEAMVDAIIATSPQPPVILIQGDHGPSVDWDDPERINLRERFANLNAYLLPGQSLPHFSSSISPVNMLRVVANLYLGSSLPLLPDRSYYSTWSQPYAFVDVTEKVSAR